MFISDATWERGSPFVPWIFWHRFVVEDPMSRYARDALFNQRGECGFVGEQGIPFNTELGNARYGMGCGVFLRGVLLLVL